MCKNVADKLTTNFSRDFFQINFMQGQSCFMR